jgi:hypothetical protein
VRWLAAAAEKRGRVAVRCWSNKGPLENIPGKYMGNVVKTYIEDEEEGKPRLPPK